MKEPRLSADGTCPGCSGTEWKLAKMVVMDGTTTIEAESEGGGFGIGGGVGRGQGGVAVNYQGMVLDTSGTLTTAVAAEHAPPPVPKKYGRKQEWLERCAEYLRKAEEERRKIDEFAFDRSRVTPGIIFEKSSCDKGLRSCASSFHWYAEGLPELHEYEERKALWDRTRICMRCGEGFVTQQDRQLAKASFEVPTFSFSKQDERCPKCETYQWKTADAYHQALLTRAAIALEVDQKRLVWAQEYASDPNPGFWKRLKHKLSDVPSLEEATTAIEDSEKKIAEIKESRLNVEKAYPDFDVARVCSKCESMYSLSSVQLTLRLRP